MNMYSVSLLKCKLYTHGWTLNQTFLKKNYFHVMYLNLTITSDLLSILCVMKDVVELSRNFQIKSFLLQKMNFLKKFSDLDTKTGKLADDVKQK